jgi:uracil phosphoribosyltransferase
MYPILSTKNTVVEHGVQPSVIILLSPLSSPYAAKSNIEEIIEITH